MKRASFRVLTNVIKSQIWLEDRVDQLHALLYEDCKDDEDRDLIVDLLNRFESLDSKRFRECLKRVATSIMNLPDFNPSNTLILALTPDRNPDSGQLVLYELKPILQELGIGEVHMGNRYDAYERIIRGHPNIERIALVDEFVGSGSTVENRYRTIAAGLARIGKNNTKITVHVVAAQLEGLLRLESAGIEVHEIIMMGKGISDQPGDVQSRINKMLNLESILEPVYKSRKLPSLGYGQAEALYRRDGGNAPNSVFPIFWWAYYRGIKTRPTVLTRNMNDA